MRRRIEVTPSARRLVTSLRDLGYSFPTAVADLIDNSVSAGASHVDVSIHFNGRESHIMIADDGEGMTERELDEGLRFGTRRKYRPEDLGRYGLGLKTASLSQGKRLTVVTRRASQYRRFYSRVLDLERVTRTDRWEILDGRGTWAFDLAIERLEAGPGTVVIIDQLDRVLPERRPESGWARRRFRTLERHTAEYLAMVFHRMLEGYAGHSVRISVNGKNVEPWNPFAPGERRSELSRLSVEVDDSGTKSVVGFRGYVLPPREAFSSQEAFDRMGGPRRWNRQQGLYIYRAGRMVQSGGWCGFRASDEHTKLARAEVDFETGLDEFFRIDVAKMRVALPAQIRGALEQPIRELCHRAQTTYRASSQISATTGKQNSNNGNGKVDPRIIAFALTVAASETGETPALGRIMRRLHDTDPDTARSLGWR